MEQSLPAAVRDLKRLMKVRGVTQEELAVAWGASRSTVISRLSGRSSLTVEELEMSLTALAIDPVEFHRGVTCGFHPELVVSVFAGTARKQVRDFHRWTIRKRRPERHYGGGELRRMADGLESLRFRDAKTARRQALEILRTSGLEPDVAAEAWGVLGVLERHRGRTAIAGSCFLRALRAGPSPLVRACLLQRIAMLVLYNGADAEGAIEAILRAREIYLTCGDLSGVGKTYVDEALVYGLSGRHRQARSAEQMALQLLDEGELTYRFAALVGSAVSSVFLGNIRRARKGLEEATKAFPKESGSLHSTWITWLKGELALLQDLNSEAVVHFIAVWDAYIELEVGPVELALISLRIAKAYCLSGDQRGCSQVLEEIVRYKPMIEQQDPFQGSVLAELLRGWTREEVSGDFLEEIYRKMHEGAPNAPPLLPLSLKPR